MSDDEHTDMSAFEIQMRLLEAMRTLAAEFIVLTERYQSAMHPEAAMKFRAVIEKWNATASELLVFERPPQEQLFDEATS